MERKSLKTLLKENKEKLTTNNVFYAYEKPINGDDGYLVKVEDLTEEELNKRYLEREWWIEDGDLCIAFRG